MPWQILETLCFIVNKFSVITKLELKSILVGFNTEKERKKFN